MVGVRGFIYLYKNLRKFHVLNHVCSFALYPKCPLKAVMLGHADQVKLNAAVCSCLCPFSDVLSLIVTLVAVSMLWSIFRLFRVASRAGGFNAFVSSLGFEQPVGSLGFYWVISSPFPSKGSAG